MFPTPLSFRDAIATISSRGVAVSAWIQLDESGRMTEFRDVFADPSYEAARERSHRVNKAIWDAQGGNFIPVGVGAAKVESSYPLAKTLDRITRPNSEYASSRGQNLVLVRS
jgi:fructose 1,6-bisphosphatase